MEAKPEFTGLKTASLHPNPPFSSSPDRTSATRSSRLSALATGSPMRGDSSGAGGWADDDLEI